jgi:hypothetical protein
VNVGRLGLWCHWSDRILESTLLFAVQKGYSPDITRLQAVLDQSAEAKHNGLSFSFQRGIAFILTIVDHRPNEEVGVIDLAVTIYISLVGSTLVQRITPAEYSLQCMIIVRHPSKICGGRLLSLSDASGFFVLGPTPDSAATHRGFASSGGQKGETIVSATGT